MKTGDNWEEVPRGRSNLIYDKTVETGQLYSIRVVATGHTTIERTILVDRFLVAIPVYLIPDGWNYYFANQVQIPVNPLSPGPRLAAVSLRRAAGSDIAKLAKTIKMAESSGYVRVTRHPVTGAELDDVNGSVLYFEPKDPRVSFFSFERDDGGSPVPPVPPPGHRTTRRSLVTPKPLMELQKLFSAYNARVGAPMTLLDGRVKILDNRYLIRFPGIESEMNVRSFAKKLGADVLRLSDPKAGFWLIEFSDPQNVGRHLEVIAQRVRSGDLASGEPNLLFQLKPHGANCVAAPAGGVARRTACLSFPDNDAYEGCQDNLSRQRVKPAWCYIAEHYGDELRYGSSAIYVATIDHGITFNSASKLSSHQEIDSTRVAYCADLDTATGVACTGAPPESDHGMASYGIISAKPDNETGISGIAPNTKHIAVHYTSMWSMDILAQVLQWVGGVRSNPPDEIQDAPNPIPPADIISCSQGHEGLDLNENVDRAIKELTCGGRKGRGTVLIFSAGNEDEAVDVDNTLATHPLTIGVANTQFIDGHEVRQFRPMRPGLHKYGSNYSDLIELCANGEGNGLGSPSLTAVHNSAGPECNGVPPAKAHGVFLHGGTSAATSMVAGAAALVLSVKSELNWQQVRDVLCKSAEKIDCANTDENGKWVWRGSGSAPPVPCNNMPRDMNWFSKWYGYGRLDVYEAVKLGCETTPVTQPPCNAFQE